MSNQATARILLVDDEPNVLKALSRILKLYDITLLTSGEEALLLAQEEAFDLVISDFRMPGMDGVRFLNRFMQLQPEAIRIILTGHADLDNAQAAINEAEVYRFINKPWNNTDLRNAVQRGLEHKKILAENRRLADQVRKQKKLLAEKDAILNALEAEEPGITKVNWSDNGAILLDDEDLKDFE
ncbi:response regulator [Methylomarinum vadi]|uniref:response regulator n=1 Tax=Methylomarinum vadi TaxID=438855 RepID=UPI0004DFAFA8|nr:response regulator [Methylomarinum vadi]